MHGMMKTTYPTWVVKWSRGATQVMLLFMIPVLLSFLSTGYWLKKYGKLNRPKYADSIYSRIVRKSYWRDKYLIQNLLYWDPY